MKPRVSIIIEAYNEEHNALAFHSSTVDALLEQDFPLGQVELIFIGTTGQIGDIDKLRPAWQPFSQVRMVTADPENKHYWQLKNKAAQLTAGEIVAFADSDVQPGPRWLSTIVSGIQNGADVVVGPSQFRTPTFGPDSPLMLAAALPTWGFVLAHNRGRETPKANSLLSHNVALRRDVFLKHPYRPFKRSFNSSLLYFELMRSGATVVYQPTQKVAHGMTFGWWFRVHFRRGWETYLGREADPSWPRIRLLEKVKPVEPVALRMGLVLRDARHWFRYTRVLEAGRIRAILWFPLALLVSFAARSAEMVGMYAALVMPRTTEHVARF
jgi:glycosyltransferase involved in cell wall biosynthesis